LNYDFLLSGLRDELTRVFSLEALSLDEEASLVELSLLELSLEPLSFEELSFELSLPAPSDLDFSSFFDAELPSSEDDGAWDLLA
ncbi:MAG: hypothetical protein WAN65_13530, partial [Candidatus Sulfotelmatobacter sp.]